jgi:hypothetical protein
VNELEADILLYLATTTGEGWYVFRRKVVEDTGATFADVRKVCHKLLREGYIEVSPVFDEYSGLLAGSGYGITRKGLEQNARNIEDTEREVGQGRGGSSNWATGQHSSAQARGNPR